MTEDQIEMISILISVAGTNGVRLLNERETVSKAWEMFGDQIKAHFDAKFARQRAA